MMDSRASRGVHQHTSERGPSEHALLSSGNLQMVNTTHNHLHWREPLLGVSCKIEVPYLEYYGVGTVIISIRD